METHVSHFRRVFVLVSAAIITTAAETRADAVSELKSLSAFETVDLAQLKGDAKTVRGPAMTTPRYLSVQTAWVAPGSPAQVSEAMQRWNPASHPEMKIFMHVNGSNFS